MNYLLNIRIRYLLVRHPDLRIPRLRAADVAGDETGLQAPRGRVQLGTRGPTEPGFDFVAGHAAEELVECHLAHALGNGTGLDLLGRNKIIVRIKEKKSLRQ